MLTPNTFLEKCGTHKDEVLGNEIELGWRGATSDEILQIDNVGQSYQSKMTSYREQIIQVKEDPEHKKLISELKDLGFWDTKKQRIDWDAIDEADEPLTEEIIEGLDAYVKAINSIENSAVVKEDVLPYLKFIDRHVVDCKNISATDPQDPNKQITGWSALPDEFKTKVLFECDWYALYLKVRNYHSLSDENKKKLRQS